MATTAIEVIDTAVKIGLGGLITLLGTIAVTKLNHGHENKKETNKRFYDALESVGANIEEMTHVSLRYWALIIEWARNNQQGFGLTEKRQEELERTKIDMFDQFKNLTVAESKLLLLDLDEPATLLREYGEFLKDLRRKYYDGKASLTEEDMELVREQLLVKREVLFKSLSESYKKGL
ncbi:hypothetical protein [Photobacterium alginatilyticum]|uniref:Coproporphyrinogen III oxidase n=1 Tax=Photobacterium alginatilyticum TaxID=1775171 RepID=A0ABW9YVB8_9GAMM|nr:hypothetical protein [Photobacterium alginatilyticum]NBI56314.1 hypothetical protein [Photobacterium alginatilyticum]